MRDNAAKIECRGRDEVSTGSGSDRVSTTAGRDYPNSYPVATTPGTDFIFPT